MLGYLIWLVVVGLVVGGLARLALPGPDPMGLGATIALGLAGSLIAGLVASVLFGRGSHGILLSTACASLVLYVIRRRRGGSLTQPPPRDR